MRALFACLFAVALCAIAAETQKPNFTGDWKLNAEKSDASGIPDDLLFKIRHNDPAFLAIQQAGGEIVEFKMGTDGKEYKNALPSGVDMVTVMKWAGDVLLSTSTIETPGGQVKFADKIMLDGKFLRVQRKISGPEADREIVLVLEK